MIQINFFRSSSKFLILLILLLLVTPVGAENAQLNSFNSTPIDNNLVVYIGAHPDDIDIGMSGSLFKNDVDRHPILWIVVTDGGSDSKEYFFERDQGLLTHNDGEYNSKQWTLPDGNTIIRTFYSQELSENRCGISGPDFNYTQYEHVYTDKTKQPSQNLTGYDWQTRVNKFVGPSVIKNVQMTYNEPSMPSKIQLFPDGSLSVNETLFTDTLAEGLASTIDKTVTDSGYRKDSISIKSHAPEEVAENADENPEHFITGNAVRKAIYLLQTKYGYGNITANWYTIYNRIQPHTGFIVVDDNIKIYRNKKTDLCKSVWETPYMMNKSNYFYSWAPSRFFVTNIDARYPDNPNDFESSVIVNYLNNGSTPLVPHISTYSPIKKIWNDLLRWLFFHLR